MRAEPRRGDQSEHRRSKGRPTERASHPRRVAHFTTA
jgi:hypothetical protein